MGRGHELLAETHALGPDGHALRQGRDRIGRVAFAWTAALAGLVLIGVASLVSVAVR